MYGSEQLLKKGAKEQERDGNRKGVSNMLRLNCNNIDELRCTDWSFRHRKGGCSRLCRCYASGTPLQARNSSHVLLLQPRHSSVLLLVLIVRDEECFLIYTAG